MIIEKLMTNLANARGRRRARGVTLMELMVVVAVISIIASIAIPSYRRYLLRSQRTEAKVALLQLQTAQEKFYMQNNAFTANVANAPPAGLGLLTTTETGKYAVSVVLGAGDQSFVATAAPAAGGGQADDTECGTYTIDERGTRGASGTLGTQACWR